MRQLPRSVTSVMGASMMRLSRRGEIVFRDGHMRSRCRRRICYSIRYLGSTRTRTRRRLSVFLLNRVLHIGVDETFVAVPVTA